MSVFSRLYNMIAGIFVVGVISICTSSGTSAITQTQTPVTDTASVTAKATIAAIDKDKRLITLKLADGSTTVVQADPSVKRFDELKVGDEVTATYTQSIAVRVRKPGEPAPAKEKATITPREGKPGATAEYEQTATVTVEKINIDVPSVMVKDENGELVTFRVRDPSRLKDLKVGDKVDITYTQAILLNADTPSPQ
jgi:Cu/Ag efflux protein CusF